MGDDIQTGASAAPTVDAAAASPAPSESPSAPVEAPSRFQALMAEEAESGEDPADEASTDGEGTEPAEGEEPEAEQAEAEKPEEEQAPPEDEDIPKDLKAVFKKFPDLRGAYYHKRDLMPLGISVDEAQEYRQNIQSLEDLRYTVNRAKQLEAFEGLFTHPDQDAPEKFLEVLRQVDDGAANRFVRTLASKLPALAPEAYYEIGGRAWETGLKNLESLAGDDPFRREAVAAVREMVEELQKSPQKSAAPTRQPLPAPDAEELAQRRAHDAKAKEDYWTGVRTSANKAADEAVRSIVADVAKRRDPDGLLLTSELNEQIVHEIHRIVAGNGAVHDLFNKAIHDTSVPEAERIAKAAVLVQARARNVADMVFKKKTDGIAERLRKVSQAKLGKAAKVVSMREATGGRPASQPAPSPKPGAKMTSRDIFRAAMRG